ncbi:hypothetical protein H6F67_13015 [Microcoleus sp. FACHB-1515]|uniref:hypothetical protein n=1 Tax=Cyanophyceae TaxID=3028117 RepID=UPI0016887D25|nr:hypothetical protein [Microcoleus sp. FACHB-1515]MBD2090774.1 hypothetical protein [Microcoleus sp. FACHB-1515]
MNSPSVAIAASPTAVQPGHHPAVLQPRLLDRSPLKLQADLYQALHQAPAVIVDLIWIDAIDASTVTVFRNALHLAARLGKSIVFHGANRQLSLLLAQEQDQLRSQSLGNWQPEPEPEFDDFLRDRSSWLSEAATIPDGEIIFPRFGLSSSQIA